MMLLWPKIFFSPLLIFSVLILLASCFITVSSSTTTNDQSKGMTSVQIDHARVLEVGMIADEKPYIVKYVPTPATFSTFFSAFLKILTGDTDNESTSSTLINGTTNFVTYENPTVGIRMQYPGDWQEEYSPPYFQRPGQNLGYNVKFISPQIAQVSSGFSAKDVAVFGIASILSPSIVSSITSLFDDDDDGIHDKNVILDKLVNARLDYLSLNLDKFEFVESTPTTLLGNNNPAHKIVYTYLDPDLGIIKEMVLVILGGENSESMYVVTYGGKTTTYEFFLPTAQRMLDSMETLSSNTMTIRSDYAININNRSNLDENIITFDPAKEKRIR